MAFDSQAGAFEIRILEPPLSDQIFFEGRGKGTISLEGRALPYRPIAYEVTQRDKTTWYPGNPVATQQVFGPVESPTVITGMWKDIFLGNGAARRLVQIFDDLCRSGSLVEVRWGGGLLPGDPFSPTNGDAYVRRGILKRFKATPDRPQDVAWEAEFKWRGRAEQTASIVNPQALGSPRQSAGEALGRMRESQGVSIEFKQSPAVLLAGFSQTVEANLARVTDALDGALSGIESALLGVNAATGSAVAIASLPVEQLERVAYLNDLALLALTNLVNQYNDLKLNTLTTGDDAAQVFNLQENWLGVLKGLTEGQEAAVNLRNLITVQKVPPVLAEVRAPAGTDLRDLAAQYYGDADLWWQIADFNNLPGSRVPDYPTGPSDDPGRPIRIPNRSNNAPGDLRKSCG